MASPTENRSGHLALHRRKEEKMPGSEREPSGIALQDQIFGLDHFCGGTCAAQLEIDRVGIWQGNGRHLGRTLRVVSGDSPGKVRGKTET